MRALERLLFDVFSAQGLPDAANVARKAIDMADLSARDAKIYELRAVLTIEELQARFSLKRTHIYRIIKRQLKLKRNT